HRGGLGGAVGGAVTGRRRTPAGAGRRRGRQRPRRRRGRRRGAARVGRGRKVGHAVRLRNAAPKVGRTTRGARGGSGSAWSTSGRRSASEGARQGPARRRRAATTARWRRRSPRPPRRWEWGRSPSERDVAVLALGELLALGAKQLEAGDQLDARLGGVDDVVDEPALGGHVGVA